MLGPGAAQEIGVFDRGEEEFKGIQLVSTLE